MKIIIITGASSGIGRSLSKLLASKRIQVLAIARNIDALETLKLSHPKYIKILSADIATEEGRDKILATIKNNGTPYALVNNAALMSPSGYLEKVDLRSWRYQLAVNLEAPLFLSTRLAPIMKGGRILNLTIYSSFRVTPGLAAYGISKAALNMLTTYLQMELKKYNILIGNALPGLVNTNIQKQLPSSMCIPTKTKIQTLIKKGKLLSPKIAAQFLAWLLLECPDDEFESKTWDIYEKEHHIHWSTEDIPILT
jgi:benzil reductase ((S)-benzoin forming)